MNWRFLDSGYGSGGINMRIDVSLADQMLTKSPPPILRLYGWRPAAISIGVNQEANDFDLHKLKQAGIDIVRRPTGGRAILHDNELTYSVVIPLQERSPRQVYRLINEGLLCGLQILGISAELTGQDDPFSSFYKDPASVPCFASSAKSEIKCNCKKLVGSAQRRYGNVILQHGSLLLGPEHLHITRYFAPHVSHSAVTIEKDLLNHTVDASSILGRAVTFKESVVAVKKGFEDSLGINFETVCWEGFEQDHAKHEHLTPA